MADRAPAGDRVRGITWAAGSLAIGLAIVALFTAAQVHRHGSVRAAAAAMRGESFSLTQVSQTRETLGAGRAGIAFTVSLRNLTAAPAQIVGGTSTCDCVAVYDLPLAIPALAERHVRVTMALPKDGSPPKPRPVRFFTARPGAQVIEMVLRPLTN